MAAKGESFALIYPDKERSESIGSVRVLVWQMDWFRLPRASRDSVA